MLSQQQAPENKRCAVAVVADRITSKIRELVKHILMDWRLTILAASAAVVLIGLISFTIWFSAMIQPVDRHSDEQMLLTVPVGSSLGQIAEKLEQRGLIRSKEAFKIYVKAAGAERSLKAGDYRLSAQMDVRQLLERLTTGELSYFTVTFPEGTTIKDIARILAKKGLVNEQDFVESVQNPDFAENYSDLTSKTGNPEGFLFPDTYRIAEGTSPEDIALMQIQRFRQIFTPEMYEEAQRLKMTVAEVVTLASIIEKEAMLPEERPIISAVFHNRLRLKRPLESCATVQYALGYHKPVLTYADLEIDSPYNTYRHAGLPPAPIANPGLDSILAALYPAEVDYLYFVAKNDGSHVFSKTYNEHLRAQRNLK
jgi:UPF0755 protein